MFIYVLELKDNKYYVGKTKDPNIRLEEHFNKFGSAWTTKYNPINVLEILPMTDDFDEDKYTLKYMKEYGIDNVRGGSFCSIKLNFNIVSTINRMIKSSTDRCYICNSDDHYAIHCDKTKSFTKKCIRCGRNNHYINDCYASTYINGKIIEDNKTCYRCGRSSHYSSNCYAKTHIKGYSI